jgi:hypothetical protein
VTTSQYDELNRLAQIDYPSPDADVTFAYDAVGNRETQSKSVLGFVTSDTYVYDDANRLTSVNAVNYSWDNDGNLLNDGVNTYTGVYPEPGEGTAMRCAPPGCTRPTMPTDSRRTRPSHATTSAAHLKPQAVR